MNEIVYMLLLWSSIVLQQCLANNMLPDYNYTLAGAFANDWVMMDKEEMLQYYTKWEVCYLEMLRQEASVDLCNELPGQNYQSKLREAGGQSPVGSYYLRHKLTKPWPLSRNLLDIVKLMRQKKSNTMVLFGDSTAQQFIREIVSELRRFGLNVSVTEYDDFASQSSQQAFIEVGNTRSFSDTDAKDDPKGKLHRNQNHHFFHIIVYSVNKPHKEFLDHFKDNVISRVLSDRIGPPLVSIGWGLWFSSYRNEQDDFRDVIKTVYDFFLPLAKQRLATVVYREVTAQHFRTPTGEFEGQVGEQSDPYNFDASAIAGLKAKIHSCPSKFSALVDDLVKHRTSPVEYIEAQSHVCDNDFNMLTSSPRRVCRPIRNEQLADKQNWKNKLLYKMSRELDPEGHIGIGPFYNISAARYDLHVWGRDDCTHWDNNPMLFAPYFDYMYNFLDSRYK